MILWWVRALSGPASHPTDAVASAPLLSSNAAHLLDAQVLELMHLWHKGVVVGAPHGLMFKTEQSSLTRAKA